MKEIERLLYELEDAWRAEDASDCCGVDFDAARKRIVDYVESIGKPRPIETMPFNVSVLLVLDTGECIKIVRRLICKTEICFLREDNWLTEDKSYEERYFVPAWSHFKDDDGCTDELIEMLISEGHAIGWKPLEVKE